jgi:hypothetical protein
MKDLVMYHEARLPYDSREVLSNGESPDRRRLLKRAAEEESREILERAYHACRGLGTHALLSRLLGRGADSPTRLGWLYLAWHPDADEAEVARWLGERGAGPVPGKIHRLIGRGAGPRLTLADYAYLLGVHPLNLWCAGELSRDPGISWEDLLERGAGARNEAQAWLFQSRNRRAQDLRLRIEIERDAFTRMTPAWRRLAFPFESLVPSLATAIGSSSDRPAALGELMGIILNDGVRLPVVRVKELTFGKDTPYHTVLETSPPSGERVMPAEVARALRGALQEVVRIGTARRLAGAFVGPGEVPAVVGGKTGSGDNRFETFAPGGRLRTSRAVSRTATFVFYCGDRYFGVMTAFVLGSRAGNYRFTSALPVELVRLLAPALNERLGRPGELPRGTEVLLESAAPGSPGRSAGTDELPFPSSSVPMDAVENVENTGRFSPIGSR